MAAPLPLPPISTPYLDPRTGAVSDVWQRYLLSLQGISNTVPPLDAAYWVSKADAVLTNEINIGALSTGYLKTTAALGTSTPSSVATIPASDLSGVVPIAKGGTNSSTALSGSSIAVSNGTAVVQGDAGTSVTVLHGNAAGTPTYSAVALASDVSGTLPVANGGTGVATLAANRIPYGNGTSAFQSAANFTFDGTTVTTPGQVAFPATQNPSANANTLDDYEEGTWTPADASGASLVFTVGTSQYVKIGQLVMAQGDVTYPATASAVGASIGGLPFTSAAAAGSATIGFTDETTLTQISLPGSTVTMILRVAGGAQITNVTMSANRVVFTALYRATA